MADAISAESLARTVPQQVGGAKVLAEAGKQILELATWGRRVDPETEALAKVYLEAANLVAKQVGHWVDGKGGIHQQGRR